MAYSYVYYWGDNSMGPFAVPFGYLSKDDVEVSVAGEFVDYTWETDQSILLDTAAPVDSKVKIQRRTKRDNRYVDFEDSSILDENDLDMDSLQAFYLIQELLDGVLTGDGSGSPISSGGGDDGGNVGAIDIDDILDELQGRIRESHLWHELQERIDLIDVDPENIQDRLAELESSFHGHVTVFQDNEVVVDGRLDEIEGDITEFEGKLAMFEIDIADYDGEVASLRDTITLVEGTVNEMSAVQWSPDSAYYVGDRVIYEGKVYEVYSIPEGYEGVTNVKPPDYPNIYREVPSIEGATEELTQRVAQAEQNATAALGEVNTLSAEISDFVKIGEFSELETRTAAAESEINVLQDDLGNMEATISDLAQVEVNDRVAAIEEKLWAGTVGATPDNPADGTLMSEWSIKLDVNGHIAGVGMSLDETGWSDFIIMANTFAIAHPTKPDEPPVFPFIVGTVDGVSTVGIDGNLIVDGTIAANKVDVLETVTVGMLDPDVTSRMFADSQKKSSELDDDAGLGSTADWNNVSGSGKPEDNANKVSLENGYLTGSGIGSVPVDNREITYDMILGSKPPANADSTEDALETAFDGVDPALVKDWASNPAGRINTQHTTIDGNKITTGSITADKIYVGNLAAISSDIGTIRSGRIQMAGQMEIGALTYFENHYGIHLGRGTGMVIDYTNSNNPIVRWGLNYGYSPTTGSPYSDQHAMWWSSDDGKLYIDGEIVNKDNVNKRAELDDEQIGVTTGHIYVTFSAKVYHGLSRTPVVTISRGYGTSTSQGDDAVDSFIGNVNDSYFEIVLTWRSTKTVYYSYV